MSRDSGTGIRRILVVTDSKRGPTATQIISFGQPFGDGADPDCSVAFEQGNRQAGEIAKVFARQAPDLLVLSRYMSSSGLEWIALARSADIPVIFHIDDDLLAVPRSLGDAKYSVYSDPERLNALRNNIESSDLLYASTAELTKRCLEHNVRTPIVAGEIYCSVSPTDIGATIPAATGPVIGYAGTSGHKSDLAMILPAICTVMDAVPSLQFEVFGTIEMPSEVARFGKRARHLPPMANYRDYVAFLRSLGWWVGLAPLEDNRFNRCKADTKWVEYSMAGMAVVASNLPVYHRACSGGGGILKGDGDWSESLLRLIYQPESRCKMIEIAQDKLRRSYTHEKLRQQVIEIFGKAVAARKRVVV
jgi:hypothetical protein